MLPTNNLKAASLIIQVIFYLAAGVNHFINPNSYYSLIPDYLSHWQVFINLIAGAAEIILAVGLIIKTTRKIACAGIILMLIAFIPSHVYFITAGITAVGPLEVTPLMAWVRLLIIHPLLIWWAWSCRKD